MKPGAGFLIFFATSIAATSFFVWGLATPDLERVWRLQIELALGKRGPLSPAERKVLGRALVRHSGMVDGMLDGRPIGIISANRDGLIENGYAYLVRKKPKVRQAIEVVATDVRGDEPLQVEVHTPHHSARGEVRAGAPLSLELPDDGPFPQLIEVRVGALEPKQKKGRRDRHAIVVRTREIQ